MKSGRFLGAEGSHIRPAASQALSQVYTFQKNGGGVVKHSLPLTSLAYHDVFLL